MNIEQYRAIKAQEEAQKTEPVVQQPEVQTVPTVEEPKPVVEVNSEPKPNEPITVEIEGRKLTLEELKNGYLRQSDYTKKTQELSRQRTESKEAIAFYDYLKANPQIAQQLKVNGGQVPDRVDPALSKVKELEDKMYDMMLEREIETLQSKYSDFEVKEILEIASEKGITNLEDAYFISKSKKGTSSNIDVESLKKQIREDLLKELDKERTSTGTIITTNTPPIQQSITPPTLSENEAKVARMMKLTPDEYIKWRDIDKKKK